MSIKHMLTHRAYRIGLLFQGLDERAATKMRDRGVSWCPLNTL